jgi:uncharacterized membrane protein
MIPFILNFIMCVSQILLVLFFWDNMNSLMIFGCLGISFGTGLTAIVEYLNLMDKRDI